MLAQATVASHRVSHPAGRPCGRLDMSSVADPWARIQAPARPSVLPCTQNASTGSRRISIWTPNDRSTPILIHRLMPPPPHGIEWRLVPGAACAKKIQNLPTWRSAFLGQRKRRPIGLHAAKGASPATADSRSAIGKGYDSNWLLRSTASVPEAPLQRPLDGWMVPQAWQGPSLHLGT